MARSALAVISAAAFGCLAGCAAAPPQSNAAVQQQPQASVLADATPAPGSTVAAPVDRLVLRFSPPARLVEVTVTGPDGTMPMMVTAVGEVPSYELPLAGLGAGEYRVNWRATVQQQPHEGSFSFTVR